jgi:integrase
MYMYRKDGPGCEHWLGGRPLQEKSARCAEKPRTPHCEHLARDEPRRIADDGRGLEDGVAANDGQGHRAWPNGEPPILAERFHFHDLRAKTVTELKEAGRDARTLSGHASDAMVEKIYDRRRVKKATPLE